MYILSVGCSLETDMQHIMQSLDLLVANPRTQQQAMLVGLAYIGKASESIE